MEAVLVLFGLVLAGLALIAPILSLIAFVRGNRQQARLDELQVQLRALEARFEALRKLNARGERDPEPEATPPQTQAGASATPPPVTPAAVPPPIPTTIPTPPIVRAAPPPVPAFTPAAEPAPLPPRLPPPVEPTPRSTPPVPPTPPTATFDWESLLGLRGAAWLGGIALVIAGLLFAKLAIDNGYFTPELRVATMLLLGVGALIGADVSLRRGYATTANAVSGAGIATLYTCFFAAYDRYHLLSLGPTFALMVLVTAVACLLSIRYDAFFVAILGLLGGFATPLVLSTGQDRPLGLFGYVLLLNLGLFAVSLRQRWHGLAALTLAATVMIQIGWFARFMEPAKLIVGLGVFALFGLLYLLLPDLRPGADTPLLRRVGSVGGLAPFFFALLIAGQARYSAEWPLLFGFVTLLDLALLFIGLYRNRPELPLAAAVATAVTLPLWASQGLTEDALYGPTLVAVALTLLMNAPGRLTQWFAAWNDERGAMWLHTAGIAAGVGLALFALPLVGHHGEPPWAYLLVLAALVAVLLERTREELWPGFFLTGALALALLTQLWFASSTDGPNLLRNLSVPLLLAIVLAIVAAARSTTLSPQGRSEYEGAVVSATLVAVAGLHGCLASPELGADPWPLFGALAVADVLLVSSALRRGWPTLLLLTLAVSTSLTTLWQLGRFQPTDVGVVLPIYAAFYLAFLALPFILPAAATRLVSTRFAPWATSALAGPCFFMPLYWAVTAAWGKGAIGLLPVAMAALSVIALFGVVQRFPAFGGGTTDARQLDRLALFAAIALGFIALAIPLQLDRQWITVAWALEGVAVWWLLERLPHAGLRLFGALLFASVGARLLFNWENVLHYDVRGHAIFNWLLYSYGVPAVCCLVGARLLKRAEHRRGLTPSSWLSPATSFLGLVLLFALINLEIADYFSAGTYVQFDWERRYARDLTMSVAWGVYAIVLLGVGVWRGVRVLRFVALGFLVLTVLKVFLFDLSSLGGVYRVFSFLGLGVALILVSLVYQRFVVKGK